MKRILALMLLVAFSSTAFSAPIPSPSTPWPMVATGTLMSADHPLQVTAGNGADVRVQSPVPFNGSINAASGTLLTSIATWTAPCFIIVTADQEWSWGIATTTRASMYSTARNMASGSAGAYFIDRPSETYNMGFTAVSTSASISVTVFPVGE